MRPGMESACHTSYCQDDIKRAMITLQTLLDDIILDALPFVWTTFDFAAFSPGKRL